MKRKIPMSECNCKAFDENYSEFRHENRKIVTVKDKGRSTYIYKNSGSCHLAKYRVDGGLISDDGAKCDFLLLNCEKKQSYFIELKGSDIRRAIEQIDRSIDKLKSNLPDFSFFARIVLSRVNTTSLTKGEYLKLEKKIKSLNGNIKQGSTLLEDAI